jgi:hypothetical protein
LSRKIKLAFCALLCALLVPSTALAWGGGRHGRHVLLISVDGLHQSDLAQWVAANPSSTLGELSKHGTTYTDALTTFPSDSFPGTLAFTTGGTPKSTGVYYDDSYDRTLYPPSDTTCQGPVGTELLYDESVDFDNSKLDGGKSPLGGQSINPADLPREKTAKGCVPVYPNQLVRVNTIFDVAHNAGLRTAWSDKHPAYQLLNGPDPNAIDDLYTPEIASDAPGGGSWTDTDAAVQQYDGFKVQAILNQVHGKPSTCSPGSCPTVGVPAIFGMNFQAVSVAQKLPSSTDKTTWDPNGCPGKSDPTCPFLGGYAPDGTFAPSMASAMQFVDQSLGQMVGDLSKAGLLRSTEIIITAKHGQSPIDPAKLHRVDPGFLTDLVTNTTGAQFASSGLNQQTSAIEDDVGLLWLSTPFQSKTGALVSALEQPANVQAGDIGKVISGADLKQLFGDPATDPRVPDVAVQPNPGGLYSFSTKKVAEHGGGAPDDRHVALLVVNPRHRKGGGSDNAAVTTTEVAPTVLRFLGLNPHALDAVREEGTKVLPAQ